MHYSIFPRAAKVLLVVLAMSMPLMSWAQEFVTDVMLVGASSLSDDSNYTMQSRTHAGVKAHTPRYESKHYTL